MKPHLTVKGLRNLLWTKMSFFTFSEHDFTIPEDDSFNRFEQGFKCYDTGLVTTGCF